MRARDAQDRDAQCARHPLRGVRSDGARKAHYKSTSSISVPSELSSLRDLRVGAMPLDPLKSDAISPRHRNPFCDPARAMIRWRVGSIGATTETVPTLRGGTVKRSGGSRGATSLFSLKGCCPRPTYRHHRLSAAILATRGAASRGVGSMQIIGCRRSPRAGSPEDGFSGTAPARSSS
jgi:hypothetical protein